MTHDETIMRLALTEAQKAYDCGETPVGAVLTWDGEPIVQTHNLRETEKLATAHAELLAIEQACKKLGGWRLHRAELFVTLEPCPMCAGAIINARIPRVVFAAKDKKAGCCGSLIDLFDLSFNHRPNYVGGVLEEEAQAMLTAFFNDLREKRRSGAKPRLRASDFAQKK